MRYRKKPVEIEAVMKRVKIKKNESILGLLCRTYRNGVRCAPCHT